MTKLKVEVTALAILLLIAGSAYGQVYQGEVDWGEQIIRATGIGAPNPRWPEKAQRPGALKAARNDALRNVLETVKGINLSSETTVHNFMTESDIIRTNVEGVLSKFVVVAERYLEDGTVEVDVEVPLSGAFTNALMPREMFSERREFASGRPSNIQYTGLIVDARGLELRPAMAPRILDGAGNEIYGTGYVSREYAIEVGIAGYSKSLGAAREDVRVADNPLVVKGVAASGSNKADVIVSDGDAAAIHAAARNLNFLDQCKVMIVVD